MKLIHSLAAAALLAGTALFRRRNVAVNATLTPLELSALGIDSLDVDAAISLRDAVVKKGSDDRHIVVSPIATAQTDIPYGVLINDEAASDEVGVVKKNVAVFGLYPGSLRCISDGA